MKKALFEFEIPLSDEYMPFFDDIIRVVIIQCVTQFMFYMYNSTDYPFFNELFFLTMIFLVLGVSAYWLIVKKIIFVKPPASVSSNNSDKQVTFTTAEQFTNHLAEEDEAPKPYDYDDDMYSEYEYS